MSFFTHPRILYHQDVFVEKQFEYLTESQLTNGEGPILIDMDFRYNAEIQERQHNEEHIQGICNIYIEKINEIKKFESMEECSFPIYVFEKPNVNTNSNKDGITKDGIHIIIGIKMNHQEQLLLRNKVMSEISEFLEELPFTNKMDDILDRGITMGSNKWQFYVSRKPGYQRYELTNIYKIEYKNNHASFAFNITMIPVEISSFI